MMEKFYDFFQKISLLPRKFVSLKILKINGTKRRLEVINFSQTGPVFEYMARKLKRCKK